MNWGDNLTLLGAVRRRGWVTLGPKWRAMTKERFIEWVRRRLAPRLQRRNVVLLDNLAAHKALEVRFFIEERGATRRYLPAYSHDFNSNRAGLGARQEAHPHRCAQVRGRPALRGARRPIRRHARSLSSVLCPRWGTATQWEPGLTCPPIRSRSLRDTRIVVAAGQAIASK